jgi:hypothetical protein
VTALIKLEAFQVKGGKCKLLVWLQYNSIN